ncbi:MAG: S8 family peptidase [Halieaceae bacterium]|jgi:subtilisin family serine protease|nr:S8 family peptidase [Halieaceae bacterium]
MTCAQRWLIAAPLALLILALPRHTIAEEQLLVMLQGSDLAEIRAAVTQAGGSITHDLPIIDAVGARMTRVQLMAAQERAGSITRVIDDLAWEPEPEPPVDDGCAFAGAIQLQWEQGRAAWRLFNKGKQPLRVAELSIAWPASLAGLDSLKADGTALPLNPDESGLSASWADDAGFALPAEGSATLHLAFSSAPSKPGAVQSEIALRAVVDDDCAAELARSYAHPDQDSYYPSVTGAALLHANNVTGKGVTVAVLDSGLWEEPGELSFDTSGRARILDRYDAIAGSRVEEAFDESGHGTHITSVLARSAPTTRAGAPQPSYRGIAPDSQIVVVKAFGRDGEAGFLDIVRGVQWVLEQRETLGIRVLNLSFSARPRWPYWLDPVNQALMKAWKAGIFVVAAAGNEGPEPMTVGSPGNLPYLVTVGAVTDHWTEDNRNDDYIPDFSSRGPTPLGHIKPDLVAPGGHIAGITRPGSTLAEDFPEYFMNSGDFVMTGSSQAASVISGLAALMLELDPTLGNDELKCLLVTASDPAIEADGRLSYSPFVQGSGLVSISRALTVGSDQCEQQDLDLDADLSDSDHFLGPAIFADDGPPSLPGQSELIAEPAATEGPSATRRWGAAEHLERLTGPDNNSPIDWLAIFQREQQLIRSIIEKPTR